MKRNYVSLLAVLLLLVSLNGHAAAPKSILILPFNIHSEKDLSFLQAGIQDMLSTRLAEKGQVTVIDKVKAAEAYRELQGEFTSDRLQETGKKYAADYVLYGSLTVLGESVSLDAQVLDVTAGALPETLSRQIAGMDGLIPEINDFARSVKEKVFNLGEPISSSGESEASSASGPQEGVPQAKSNLSPGYFMTPQDRIQVSSLGPNIIERGQYGKPLLWKSHAFPIHIKGFDIGDIDGNGKNELVLITEREVRAYKWTDPGGLGEIAKFDIGAFNMLVTVDVADLNNDGVAEIYVVNEVGTMGETSSFVLEMRSGRLIPVIQNIPWNFRVILDPETSEPMLVGQRKTAEGLQAGIYVLKRSAAQITEGKQLTVPVGATAFNFSLADLNNDGKILVVLINGDDYLEVETRSGDSLWESEYYFGGTMNYLTVKQDNAFTSEASERLYVPARIVIADMNEDGVPEVLVNRNKSATFRLTSRYRFFSGCHIVSLTWKGIGLMEDWTTTRIPGYVSDFQLKDLDGDGKKDLVAAMVKLDPSGIKEPRSIFVSFQLAQASNSGQPNSGQPSEWSSE
ncbi:MAG: VCBS repeat-containing protein [Deltaproteobacteria bacterium]|nr:VCBS repeat-containing protein [Deltaproteobacteria bacterium]